MGYFARRIKPIPDNFKLLSAYVAWVGFSHLFPPRFLRYFTTNWRLCPDTKQLLRERVVSFVNAGHTQEEASLIFNVGTTAIKRWKQQLAQTGSLEDKRLNRVARVFTSEALNAYIEKNPDALLKDVAEHFNAWIAGAFYALGREKITLKKREIL